MVSVNIGDPGVLQIIDKRLPFKKRRTPEVRPGPAAWTPGGRGREDRVLFYGKSAAVSQLEEGGAINLILLIMNRLAHHYLTPKSLCLLLRNR
jgi:hypothetical protein